MPRMFHQANATTSLSPGLPGALGAPLLGYRALGFSVVVDLRLSELLGGWRGTICVWPGACAQVWTNGPEQRDLRTERDAMWELKMGSGLGIATHLARRSSSLSLAPGFGTRKTGHVDRFVRSFLAKSMSCPGSRLQNLAVDCA